MNVGQLSVPPGFAFAVKAPQEIRHQLRWASADAALKAILAHAAGLGALLIRFFHNTAAGAAETRLGGSLPIRENRG
jgi:uncharacterized protein YecE (DUF72 family)